MAWGALQNLASHMDIKVFMAFILEDLFTRPTAHGVTHLFMFCAAFGAELRQHMVKLFNNTPSIKYMWCYIPPMEACTIYDLEAYPVATSGSQPMRGGKSSRTFWLYVLKSANSGHRSIHYQPSPQRTQQATSCGRRQDTWGRQWRQSL